MGLDMYAFSKAKNEDDYTEFFYWRKNNALHGWMENLAISRGLVESGDDFNCKKLQLSFEDIKQLRHDVKVGLTPTNGFFFGTQEYSDFQQEQDLLFCSKAINILMDKREVYYDSWW